VETDHGNLRLVELEQRVIERVALTTDRDVAELFDRVRLFSSPQEEFWVVAYDSGLNVRTAARITRGEYHQTSVALPALFAVVLGSGASRFLVAHNHPGGTARPSDGDRQPTGGISRRPFGLDR
jgi:DNA repair protein RadC